MFVGSPPSNIDQRWIVVFLAPDKGTITHQDYVIFSTVFDQFIFSHKWM